MLSFRILMSKVGVYFRLLVTTLLLMVASTSVVQADEDPLMVTEICHDAKSRAAAIKLFEYSDKQFAKFKKIKPLRDQISVGKMYEDGPDAEFHDVTFDTFQANFILEKNGDRNLITLSTKSTKFLLPLGLKLGQSKEQVRKILGPPTAISSKTLLYQIGGEAISDVLFNFEGNKLAEVSWNYGWAD